MEKLKDLSKRFQGFLANTFPNFSELSLSNIPVLGGLEDKITKKRPLVGFQIVNSNMDQLLEQIEQTTGDISDSQLAVVLENAKTLLSFKKKIIEANKTNYFKFSAVANVSLFQRVFSEAVSYLRTLFRSYQSSMIKHSDCLSWTAPGPLIHAKSCQTCFLWLATLQTTYRCLARQ